VKTFGQSGGQPRLTLFHGESMPRYVTLLGSLMVMVMVVEYVPGLWRKGVAVLGLALAIQGRSLFD
jgi:hypothetical protein